MCQFVPLGPNTFTCARVFSYLAHVNVFESQLELPVAIVSALLIGRSAAFPAVSFCLCERDQILILAADSSARRAHACRVAVKTEGVQSVNRNRLKLIKSRQNLKSITNRLGGT